MKILLLTNSLMLGGIETNISLLTKEFINKGHDVLVVSSGGIIEREVCRNGGKISNIKIPHSNPIGSILELADTIQSWKPDVIHVFAAYASLYLWFALKIYALKNRLEKKPIVISSVMGLQNSPDELLIKTQLRNFLLTLGMKKIIIIAPAIYELMKKLPVSKARFIERKVVGVRIPSPLESREKVGIRKELGVDDRERIVITIGALAPRKSHEFFIETAYKIIKQRSDVHFFIVGEGKLRNYYEGRIHQYNIANNVHLLGIRQDILRLLAVSDIYVKPGIVEGFAGITVMEAQSMGVPVVAFDTKDVRLVIEHGVTGIIVPKCDTDELASAILLLLENKELSKEIREAGQAFIEREYSISVVVKELIELYNALLSENR
ncbi:MAG: glycosyltransferase family 4 protein [Nitrospirae bacterium]|nr:glycosyltransferase family 4 protein [Nitrospirota bacterium]MCL5976742.1 glycosyltransferase family 4 protein [Nitrospirota bacterium]